MTDQDLNGEWAQSQLEAWADGSLTGANLERMNAVLRSDARLRAASDRAVAVRRALHEPSGAPLSAGLRLRLLAIPSKPLRSWRGLALPVAAASALAIVAVAFLLRPPVPPLAPPDPRVAAIEDFELAMRYLQKSARMTESGVTIAVGTGLREALTTSRESLERTTKETGG